MTKMIQLRNVPDALHRKLKARAAEAGMTLSDFLVREAKILAEQPTLEEMRRRLASLPPVTLDVSVADIIREERDKR
jgi:antitoxin FitA